MEIKMVYKKELAVRYDTDVLVVGGGPSGVAAAITAARKGKRVLILENNGCFGGEGTTGLVPTFTQFTDGKDFLVGGIGREIRDLTIGEYCDYKRDFYAFNVERLKRVYDTLVMNERNIEFLFFTKMVDVVAHDDHVDCVIAASKSGIFAIHAKIYIDCTGDGDLCAWAGADFEYGDENGDVMPPTLCSLWSNIDYSCVEPLHNKLEVAFKDGVFTNEDRHIPGVISAYQEKGIGVGNVGHVFGANGTDDVSLTKAMVEGRKIVSEFETFFNGYVQGYENAHLCYTADMLGIRESRRIVGDYQLCGEDFKRRAVFDDEIGRYAYPVDIHIMKPNKEAYDAYKEEFTKTMVYGIGESYGIPYRILTPAKLSNVLVAGRCVSTDRQMQASIRVMPGCYITGQAAGDAAVLACESEDTRKVNISQLQSEIVKSGGIIVNRNR
ncbi:MAG: FAD-dependent oxidoreductase [Tyzzerella sp.]|nr:FAD-dependent oxidoreductase [Tyzzerella sp.]